MKTLSPVKQGDTFAFIAAITDTITGAPSVGIASKLKSEVRTVDGLLLATLEITETDAPGSYLFKTNDTSGWPTSKTVYTDIQYTDGDVVTSSETIQIPVEKDVTKNG